MLFVAVAFVAWLGYQASQAKSNLEEARQDIQSSKDALLRGDTEEAANWADKALSNAESARAHTDSVPWNVASAIPWVGGPLKSGQQIADVVLVAVADVLQPSVQIGQAMSPDRLLKDGRVDVQLLRKAEPKLAEVSAAATRLEFQANAISDPHYFSTLREARQQLQIQTSDLAGLIRNTALAARIAPSMMGADGPRAYFMGFQTNAEARGTGGLLGGFGILRFDNGVATVDELGRNSELDKPFTPMGFGDDFADQWGVSDPSTDFRNSNMSPHFPYTAQIWRSMWQQQSGMTVDGALSIDPVALSYILGAVGPVTMPDGEVISKDNVVELTESTAYTRFADDNDARKQYLQDVASEVVKKVTGPLPSARKLLEALGKGVSEGRIAVWSSFPAEQQILEETRLAHVVPEDPAPYAAVVVNNIGGNKLDYYLTRHIEYSAGACDGSTRKSTVTVRLTNNAPAGGLTDYVGGVHDLPFKMPTGTNASWVSLIGTVNAELTNATIDGEQLTVAYGEERGHPVFNSQVAMEPGRTIELRFELTEPASPGAARVPIQPLVDDVQPVVSVPECSANEQ